MAADVTTGALSASLAGVTATAVAAMGLQPETLVPAFVGTAVGSILGESIGRGKAALAFFFVVYAAALLGTLLARAAGGDMWQTKGCALGLGMFFHLLYGLAVRHMGKLFAALARRFGVNVESEQ